MHEPLNPLLNPGTLARVSRCRAGFDGRKPPQACGLRLGQFEIIRVGRRAIVERLDPCPVISRIGKRLGIGKTELGRNKRRILRANPE